MNLHKEAGKWLLVMLCIGTSVILMVSLGHSTWVVPNGEKEVEVVDFAGVGRFVGTTGFRFLLEIGFDGMNQGIACGNGSSLVYFSSSQDVFKVNGNSANLEDILLRKTLLPRKDGKCEYDRFGDLALLENENILVVPMTASNCENSSKLVLADADKLELINEIAMEGSNDLSYVAHFSEQDLLFTGNQSLVTMIIALNTDDFSRNVSRDVPLSQTLDNVKGATMVGDTHLYLATDTNGKQKIFRVEIGSGLVEETLSLDTGAKGKGLAFCDLSDAGHGKLHFLTTGRRSAIDVFIACFVCVQVLFFMTCLLFLKICWIPKTTSDIDDELILAMAEGDMEILDNPEVKSLAPFYTPCGFEAWCKHITFYVTFFCLSVLVAFFAAFYASGSIHFVYHFQ